MNIALVLSGGTGARLQSDIPKQYIKVCQKPVIMYCMEIIAIHPMIDRIQIVADERWQKAIQTWITGTEAEKKFSGFSEPGETRQLSVCHGLKDILSYAKKTDVVMIHDAARPLLSTELITNCLETVKRHDGVLPVLPMKDTVYFSENGQTVDKLLERNKIFAGQAPECFVLGKYATANEKLFPDLIKKINGSAEPAVMDGMDIAVISGDENNFKITTQTDLDRFCQVIESKNK